MTVAQFAEIAKKYIDTAKSDKPISSITFIGQKPNGCLPSPASDEDYDGSEFRKNYIITIVFKNNFPQYQSNHGINEIDIWYKKYPVNPVYSYDKRIVDSLMNSKTLLDNGN